MLLTLPYPQIDPIAVELGPLALRWYGLAYIAGLVLGWQYCKALTARTPDDALSRAAFDDFLLWATLGVLLGGRLGYVVFYQPGHFLEHPAQAVMLWQGGMSFHGGLLGVVAAIVLFARKRGLRLLAFADIIACAAPIGLFFGRVANFINGELWGRPAPDVPWAMVFPTGGPIARHPSQLYEALLEGVVLFAVLFLMQRRGWLASPGVATGIFVAGYGVARFIVEFFRAPDPFLGYLALGATMGQLLSLPMILAGAGLIAWGVRRERAA